MDNTCKNLQNSVDKILTRHKSILDIITKIQESSARINRSVVKSVTSCGCVSIKATKHDIPKDIDYTDIHTYIHDHLDGELCDLCREKITREIGRNLFYLAALANSFNMDIDTIIKTECDKVKTLGTFTLY